MIGGNLDQDDPDAIGVLDPHLDQSPRLCCGFPDDADSGCDQPGVLGVDIPFLDPDHHRVPGRAGRVPGNFEQSRAQEEHHSGIVPRAELPVDGQAQDIAVEAAAALQVAGAQEDPAAQNIHATISAPRRVTSEVKQNAHSAALCTATVVNDGHHLGPFSERGQYRPEPADLRSITSHRWVHARPMGLIWVPSRPRSRLSSAGVPPT